MIDFPTVSAGDHIRPSARIENAKRAAAAAYARGDFGVGVGPQVDRVTPSITCRAALSTDTDAREPVIVGGVETSDTERVLLKAYGVGEILGSDTPDESPDLDAPASTWFDHTTAVTLRGGSAGEIVPVVLEGIARANVTGTGGYAEMTASGLRATRMRTSIRVLYLEGAASVVLLGHHHVGRRIFITREAISAFDATVGFGSAVNLPSGDCEPCELTYVNNVATLTPLGADRHPVANLSSTEIPVNTYIAASEVAGGGWFVDFLDCAAKT